MKLRLTGINFKLQSELSHANLSSPEDGRGGDLFVLLSEILKKLHGRDTSEKAFILSNSRRNDFEFFRVTTSPSCPNVFSSKLLAMENEGCHVSGFDSFQWHVRPICHVTFLTLKWLLYLYYIALCGSKTTWPVEMHDHASYCETHIRQMKIII